MAEVPEDEAGAAPEALVHATCVAARVDGGWRAVLLRGPSGAGKSALALRLIDAGWRLVSDDQTLLRRAPGAPAAVLAAAPPRIAGLLEVRGMGVVSLPEIARAEVALVVDLMPAERIERLPDPDDCELLGVRLAHLALAPDDPLAPAKLKLLLDGARRLDPEAGVPERSDTTTDEGGKKMTRNATDPQDSPEGNRSEASGPPSRRPIVLVTGLSGAGLSLALNTLEDLGYEAMSNLPLELVGQVIGEGAMPPASRLIDPKPIALGIDSRTRDFAVEPLLALHRDLKGNPRFAASLIYLHSDEDVLGRRFTETRRRHPLAVDRPLADGIAAERRMISPLRANADLVIDTSDLLPADFRRILAGHFALKGGRKMTIVVTSFSYKRGLPRAADLVFDVRFLDNPHYQDELRPLTGQDAPVVAFIEADPDFAAFFSGLEAMLLPLLPRYEREGKAYLTIALGCTGGRHRSVALACKLAARLESLGRPVTLMHRDLVTAADHK